MMTGELFLFTWRLEMTLAEGGLVNQGGDLGYNYTLANTQISHRIKRR